LTSNQYEHLFLCHSNSFASLSSASDWFSWMFWS
jgi:hypothetical protein